MIGNNYDFPPEQNNNKMSLSYKNLIVVIGLALIFEILTGFVIGIIKGSDTQAFMQSSIGTIILSLASNLGYMASIAIVYGFRETIYDLFKKSQRVILTGLKWGAIGIVLNLVIAVAMNFIYELVGITPTEQNITQVLKNLSGMQLIMTMAFASFIIPVFEEIIFRGVLQRTIQHNTTPIKGLVIASLIFAIIHTDWYQLPNLFVLGMCFGIAYNKTKSIYGAMVAHIFNNTFAMVMMLIATSIN